jgi:hypothetical protein
LKNLNSLKLRLYRINFFLLLELKFLLISEGKSFKTLIFRKETILTEFSPKKFFNLLVNFRNALKALSKP